jgi:N4-gp56 family major capsid protein
MGNTSTTTNPTDFANNLQTYFNPKFLKVLQDELHLPDYATRGKFPAIGTSIRFFRVQLASTTSVGAPPSQGSPPTNLTETSRGYVDVSLSQRSALAKITDIVTAVDLVNTVNLVHGAMARNAAKDLQEQIRAALVTGVASSNTNYGSTLAWPERFAGVQNSGTSSTDFTSLANGTAANGKLTRAVHIGCVTQLKAKRIPTQMAGNYVAVCSPQTIHDMRQDTTWVSAAVFDVGTLYKRGMMKLDGCIFVEETNPFIESVYGTYDANGTVFSNFYLGDEAFAVAELSNTKAGSTPFAPSFIILTGPDKSDPVNQLVTLGWKAYYGAKAFICTTDGSTLLSGEFPHYIQLRTRSTAS